MTSQKLIICLKFYNFDPLNINYYSFDLTEHSFWFCPCMRLWLCFEVFIHFPLHLIPSFVAWVILLSHSQSLTPTSTKAKSVFLLLLFVLLNLQYGPSLFSPTCSLFWPYLIVCQKIRKSKSRLYMIFQKLKMKFEADFLKLGWMCF